MCLIFSIKAVLQKLMELCMNLNKPSSLVHVGLGPLTGIQQYEGENLLNRDSIFRTVSHSSSAFPKVNNQIDQNCISLFKHAAIYIHLKFYAVLQVSS